MTTEQRLEAIERSLCEVNELLRQKPGDNPVLERQQIDNDPKSIDVPALKLPEQCDWEVLEFKGYTRMQNGSFVLNDEVAYCRFAADHLIEYGIPIHSVRRTTDGQVFTVGDSAGVYNNRPIRSFGIDGEALTVHFDGQSFCLLASLVKQVTFTTADGIAVKEGDTVYEYSNGVIMKTHFAVGKTYSGPLYSTREAAMKANQPPIYTSADGVDIYEGGTVYFWFVTSHEIVEDKAHKWDSPYNHYSTKASAESAYKNWLYDQPVLKLSDVSGDNFTALVELVKSRLV